MVDLLGLGSRDAHTLALRRGWTGHAALGHNSKLNYIFRSPWLSASFRHPPPCPRCAPTSPLSPRGQPRASGRLGTRALYEQVAEQLRTRILAAHAGAGQLDRRADARRRIRHQPHAAARGAEGAGRRRPGDDEAAPRRLRHRGVGARPGRGLPPARAAGERRRRASSPQQATPAEIAELLALHDAARSGRRRPRRASSPPTSASTCACSRSPTTAGASRWWPTCAR